MILWKIFRYDALPNEEAAERKLGKDAASVCTAGKSGKARIESLIGYGLLKELLGDDFSSSRLHRDDHGRPYLEGLPVDFNLSHTNGLVICAVEKDVNAPRIGVDAETICGRVPAEMEKIAARWFTEAEKEKFFRTPTEETFLSIWTAKEAMVKWIGSGLSELRKTETATGSARLPDGTPLILSTERISDTVITICTRAGNGENFFS